MKLHQSGKIELPPKKRTAPKRIVGSLWVDHDVLPISGKLKRIQPLRVEIVQSPSKNYRLFQCFLDRYHYLPSNGTVGKKMIGISFFFGMSDGQS